MRCSFNQQKNYNSDLALQPVKQSLLVNVHNAKSEIVLNFPLHFQEYSINNDSTNEF